MKSLKFLLLTLSLLIIFSVPAYAGDEELIPLVPDFRELVVKEDGSYYDYFIRACNFHTSSRGQWELYVLSEPVHPSYIEDNIYKTERCPKILKSYYMYTDSTSWSPLLPDDYIGYLSIGTPINDYNSSLRYDECLIYSSYDVEYQGEVVFLAPRSTLGQMIQTIPRTMKTGVLKQVAYLLPCLISFIIGFLAFRKAWNWLKMQLVI